MSTALRKKMHQDLQLASLSEGTHDVYLRAVRQLAVHFHTPPDVLNEAQVRDYLLHLKNDRKFPSARELVRENRRNSQDRVDAFPVDGALGWRLRLPD